MNKKKNFNLKLVSFSFFLAINTITYSSPVFQTGVGTDSAVAGVENTADGDRSSAFGVSNTASGNYGSAFGISNTASGNYGSAFGFDNTASGDRSSAFGISNTVNGDRSSSLGYLNEVYGERNSAFGYLNEVRGNKSSAFGNSYKITGEQSGAFGVGEYDGGYNYVNEGNNSYMIGNKNKIASGSDNNFILGNNIAIGSGIQNSVALGNNSTVSSSNEVSVGSATQQRKITNVADGNVSATSTDAITGKQLYRVMQTSGALGIENLRNEVNEKINDVKNEVSGIGSLSAALAGLHPIQYDPKAPAQVMAALGHYRNKKSVAVGLGYYFNDRFMMSTGIAISGEKKAKTMANIGFTVKLGKGSDVIYDETPLYTIQDEVKRLTVENNKQAKENQELKERVKNLEKKLEVLLKNK